MLQFLFYLCFTTVYLHHASFPERVEFIQGARWLVDGKTRWRKKTEMKMNVINVMR